MKLLAVFVNEMVFEGIHEITDHLGEEGYPGNANVQVSYVLTNHNEILVQFSANTDKSTLMNLSSNFYLNLDGEVSCTTITIYFPPSITLKNSCVP